MIYRLGVKSDNAEIEDHGVDSAHANPMALIRPTPTLGFGFPQPAPGLGRTSALSRPTPRLTTRRQFTERRAWAPRRFEAKDSSMYHGSALID
jgi:hypothetical protein